LPFPPASASPPFLSPYQFSWLGYTFGAGQPFELTKIEGFDMGNVRSGDAGRSRDAGRFIGLDLMDGRDVTFTGELGTPQQPVTPAVNLVPNPSFEYDTLGGTPAGWATTTAPWLTSGAVLTVINTDQELGSRSCQVVCPATVSSGAAAGSFPIVSGQLYSALIAVKKISGGANLQVLVGENQGANVAHTLAFNVAPSTWTVYSVTFVAASTGSATLFVTTVSAIAATFLFDAAMVVPGVPQPYGDGDSSGWTWTGVPGNSVSQQLASYVNTFAQAWAALASVLVPGGVTESPLWFNLPGWGTLAIMARVRKHNMPLDIQAVLGNLANLVVQFSASDPRIYSTPTQTASVGLPVPSAGMSFPITFPLSFGGGGTVGALSVTNTGNYETRPLLVVNGPCVTPTIQNNTVLGAPYVSFGMSLNTGDTLVIDTDMHTATYFTPGFTVGTPRSSTIQAGSNWWSLLSGVNRLSFTSKDLVASAGTLSVQFASAYIL
jgi:hypothetical protein